MMWILVALAVLGLVLVLWALSLYNRLVRTRVQAENAWADIDVQLKRRADLIPNLVETVKGYAGHEQETLTELTRAREGALAARDADPATRAAAEGAVSSALHGLSVRLEAYPELQASGNFRELQGQLAQVEHDLQGARRYYNASVRELNTSVQEFPAMLIAGPMGFRQREFFEATESDRVVPAVRF